MASVQTKSKRMTISRASDQRDLEQSCWPTDMDSLTYIMSGIAFLE